MHPNPAFRPKLEAGDERQMIEALVREIGFGMVFFTTPDGPRAAHVPFFSTGDGALQFHLAHGNALTRHITGQTVLAVVNGADAYVSPDWYEVPDQVPTWNYISAEMEGPVRQMDTEGLIALLDDLSELQETRLLPKHPWTRSKINADTFDKMLKAIVGFEIEIKAWRPTFKLSQNKSVEARERVAAQLEAQGHNAMALMMRTLGSPV